MKESQPSSQHSPQLIGIIGARDGVGKSSIAFNLSIYFTGMGKKVLLVDADPLFPYLETLFDPNKSLRPLPETTHPLTQGKEQTAMGPRPTSVQGLSVWTAMGSKPFYVSRRRLLDACKQSDADLVVIDFGASFSGHVLKAFLSCDEKIVVSSAERGAIDATYGLMTKIFLHELRQKIYSKEEHLQLRKRVMTMGHWPLPLDLWRSFEEDGAPIAERILQVMNGLRLSLVVNMVRLRKDNDLLEWMRIVSHRRLGLDIKAIASLDQDEAWGETMRNKRSVMVDAPGSKTAKGIERLGRRLLGNESRFISLRNDVPRDSHHDLLEVGLYATEEEVRRGYSKAKEVFDASSIAIAGLYVPAELKRVHARMDEAYQVLLDSKKRRIYELSVFPVHASDMDKHIPRRSNPQPESMPAIDANTVFDGSMLRGVRESLGIDLEEISRKSKVKSKYLSAIEDDRHHDLPEPVFVRGFLVELAKELGLNPNQVSKTYLKQMQERSPAKHT